MAVSTNWCEFTLDEHGRVVLTDSELDHLLEGADVVSAGGANERCAGVNGGCTNNNCDNSLNGSCTNSGCDGTTNSVSCENRAIRK